MLRATIQAIMSGFTAVALFTLGWIWYYVTLGWRWYVNKVTEYRQREFFTWRYRMTAVLIFVLVYLFVLRKFGHK